MPKRDTGLRRQARRIIYNVVNYMQKEKDEGVNNVSQVQQRAAEATGTSIRTVRNIIAEGKMSAFRTPGKKRMKPKPISDLNDFNKGIIKRCIHNFHETEKELPTLKKLLAKFKVDINFKGSASTLNKIIKDLGFQWMKTENNGKLLIEKHDIRIKRIIYLRKIKKYREEGRKIVYTDESYVHSSHTEQKALFDESDKRLNRSSTEKSHRIIMVHAGSETGFIPNALLMFQSETKSSNYHGDIHFINYEEWIKTKLIPNLSPNSVIVINNASYHNKLKDPAPTPYSSRGEMELWLTQKGILFRKEMLKPELYGLINQHTQKKYLIDEILAEHNHIVLRLPPYHPDLNPIKMAWADVKKYIAEKNVDVNINLTMGLIKEKVSIMGKEEWSALCAKVKEIEDQYRYSDNAVDAMTEEFIIYTGNCSESDSQSEDENSEEADSD